MVKVKNKVLIALSILLCAVLLSGIVSFVGLKGGNVSLKADSIANPTEPGYYELNQDGTAWEQKMTWETFKTNHITITDGAIKVCNDEVGNALTGFLVWGEMTETITNCSAMFNWHKQGVGDLGTNFVGLDLKNLNTSQVSDMTAMFFWCENLIYLDISSLDTSNVDLMEQMFQGCVSLKEVDISSFDTNKVECFNSMFADCNNLSYIDLSQLNISGEINELFLNCSSLKYLDLSKFDFTGAMYNCDDVFTGCTNLTRIKLPKGMVDDYEIPLPASWSTKLQGKGAEKYALVNDSTKTQITAFTNELLQAHAGETIELYTADNVSLATPQAPIEPATGVNASVVVIVCSIVAVLMIVITYAVVSNKKNNKRKVNAINVDNNKRK